MKSFSLLGKKYLLKSRSLSSIGNGGEAHYTLPSGKPIEIGFIDLKRYDGLPWKCLGVHPDIRVEQTKLIF